MQRPEMNIVEVVTMILDIEKELGVKCLSYGLYDKTFKKYITEDNKNESFDYRDAFDNRYRLRYTCKFTKDNIVLYLLKHHGELYFPMLKKGTQKAYIAQFDVKELFTKYESNCSITPSKYFMENYNFVWTDKKQCKGQLVLPLSEMR